MAFGLYVHIPYCVKKCPFCDFNSHVRESGIPEEEYTAALIAELEQRAGLLEGRVLDTVFFGGGTPSLFSPESIGKVLDAALGIARPSAGIEVTIEVNPRTADRARLEGFRHSGVNRISTGVQSFSAEKLELLGRINDPEDSARILEDIPAAGFGNFSLDLMFGVPGETPERWEDDLRTASGFGSSHISCYALTIEPGTEFATLYRRGELALPPEDEALSMLELTPRVLDGYGYGRYEISNFSKPGRECAHNLIYWRGGDYLGLGAGAHSHLGRGFEPETGEAPWGRRWANVMSPELYMGKCRGRESPVRFSETLTRRDAVSDRLLMGLRLGEGVSTAELRDCFSARVGGELLGGLASKGLIDDIEGNISFTEKGVMLSDELILRIDRSIELF